MSYEMNAEGVNGVQQTTYMVVNTGGGGWIIPPPPPDVPLPQVNGSALLFVSAIQGEPNPTLAAVQGLGCTGGPGVIGQTETGPFGGSHSGVGVAGFNISGENVTNGTTAFNRSLGQMAGVFGECDGGPGVKGQGGKAINTSIGEFFSGGALPAGIGVLGVGGLGAAANQEQDPTDPNKLTEIPAMPAQSGVIGLGGGAPMPPDSQTNSTGVVGMGSPAANGFDAGRGGVFGSVGNVAQLRLILPPGAAPNLPMSGRLGDLYFNANGGRAALFICVLPSNETLTPPTPALWAPFIMGVVQTGGTPPAPPSP